MSIFMKLTKTKTCVMYRLLRREKETTYDMIKKVSEAMDSTRFGFQVSELYV